jgi:hypothetical protein
MLLVMRQRCRRPPVLLSCSRYLGTAAACGMSSFD